MNASCKKQLIMTAFVLSCALLVFLLYFFEPTGVAYDGDVAVFIPAASLDAALPSPSDNGEAHISRQPTRLVLCGALPFSIDKLRLISLAQITLIAILIGLFIKSDDPMLESTLDSDGKK